MPSHELLTSNATTICTTLNDIVHIKSEILKTPQPLQNCRDAWRERLSHLRTVTDSAHLSLTALAMEIDLQPEPHAVIAKKESWTLWLLQKQAMDTTEKRMKEVEALFWKDEIKGKL